MPKHHFISYSASDAEKFALKLADDLQAGPPSFPIWIFRRELHAAAGDWDTQIHEAIRDSDSLIFVMSHDSVTDESVCKPEWTAALKFKKPILLLRLHADADAPFRIASRQYIDFVGDYNVGLARLRKELQWLHSPEGELRTLEFRLKDATRDYDRATDADRLRIQADIDLLQKQIAAQREVVKNPEAAAQRTAQSIERAIERERAPVTPISGITRTKFINPPPGIAPNYFQDRYEENKIVAAFLRDDARRMLTIVGRAGIGKTAMVCRLLKALEAGQLPDDLGALSVDGIVYLSAVGSRRIVFPNLFEDLLKLLPDAAARNLESLYQNPQISTDAKTRALLAAFPSGRVILLLDNFEDVVATESQNVSDAELDEALRALLTAPHHAVKIILTTRVAPHDLLLVEPARQARLNLDEGLESPYAENILREMDADSRLGLKNAADALLARARAYTRGFPRALEALVAILSADRYTTLEEILGGIAETSRRDVSTMPENIVEALVGQAFNRLDPTAERVMQALAVYARPVSPAALDYLLQPHLPGVDSAPALNRLVNMQFVRREAGKYYQHPVDRAYAFARIDLSPQPPFLQGKGERGSPSRLGQGKKRSPSHSGEGQGERSAFTQRALLHRAADYFAQTRKPRENWKTLADLEPQLNEFDLRCAADDYDTAASVLLEIDFDYLLLWGHYRLMIELHERLRGKITDWTSRKLNVGRLGLGYESTGQIQKSIACYNEALEIARENKDRWGEGAWLGNLGNCYSTLGETRRAIELYEQALAIAREIGDKRGEGADLGNLGNAYSALGETRRAIQFHEQALAISREIGDKQGEGSDLGSLGNAYSALGETRRAIEFHEQALAIAREIGDKRGEGNRLGNLGTAYSALGETRRAIEFYEQALANAREIGNRLGEGHRHGNLAGVLIDAERSTEAIEHARESIKIGEEISSPVLCNSHGVTLALAHLYSGNLPAARAAAETARKYDEPQNNHNVLALLGIIALRQNDNAAAQEAFRAAIAHADMMLERNAQNYDALDAKGIALCGMGLMADLTGFQNLSGLAVTAFRAARAINKDAGIVASVVRLLDALALADPQGAEKLAEARRAANGD